MTAADIMQTEVVSVKPQTPISEVAEVLHANNFSGVPVVNELGRVVGVISERELFSVDYTLHYPTYIRLLQHTNFILGGNKNLPYEAGRITRITAEEVMNKRVYFAPPDTDLGRLASRMLAQDIGVVPVVDAANRLLGIISKGDVLKFFPGVQNLSKPLSKPRYVDKEFEVVQQDLSSHFAMVTKARANIWLTTAVVLFIVGFLMGIVYVVNPNIFGR